MHDSKVRSRLEAQLTKFSSELSGGLPEPPAGSCRRYCSASSRARM